jgi:hypothetical protein
MSFCKGHGCSTAAPILALREAMTIAKGSTLIMHWGWRYGGCLLRRSKALAPITTNHQLQVGEGTTDERNNLRLRQDVFRANVAVVCRDSGCGGWVVVTQVQMDCAYYGWGWVTICAL